MLIGLRVLVSIGAAVSTIVFYVSRLVARLQGPGLSRWIRVRVCFMVLSVLVRIRACECVWVVVLGLAFAACVVCCFSVDSLVLMFGRWDITFVMLFVMVVIGA